ncbi:NAD(P)-binding protein [Auricularia subglabra TFB-10046 SS5]|nr:NAD(P)-binding protein [Auricularia subglabra TFB-10046 SS5]
MGLSDDRVVLVGVSETGIGGATAHALARGGPKTLTLAGRTESRVKPCIERARAANGGVNVMFLQLDLASLASVRAAAKTIIDDPSIPALDILINNAGVAGQKFTKTEDGIEEMFGVCHVGHWLLTSLLMPKLLSAPEPRVVNVSSGGYLYWDGNFEDYNFETPGRPYDPLVAYGQAKAGNVVFSKALAKKFGDRGLRSYSVQPGWVLTNIISHWTKEESERSLKVAIEAGIEASGPKTLEQGCATTLVAALDPGLPNGSYLDDCHPKNVKGKTQDEEHIDVLWRVSEKCTGETFWAA